MRVRVRFEGRHGECLQANESISHATTYDTNKAFILVSKAYHLLKPPSKSPIMLALVFASKNSSFISPMSSRVISERPASCETRDAGANSCRAYLRTSGELERFSKITKLGQHTSGKRVRLQRQSCPELLGRESNPPPEPSVGRQLQPAPCYNLRS